MTNQEKPKYQKRNPQPEPIDLAGRKPPSDEAIEAAVLGALLIAKDAYSTVCDSLRPEIFYKPEHQHCRARRSDE